MSENKKDTFLQGAAVLGIAGVLVKVLGAIFRIPLVWIISSVGLGYYQTAYPIYVMLVAIATSGFPVAISKMVSERRVVGNYKGAEKVFKLIFKVLLCFGLLASSAVFFGADYIVSEKLNNPKAYLAMISLSPALLLVPIMASFRGYFQGHNDMKPSAVSQIIEQLARVIFGIALAIILMPKGLEYGAAGATSGATAGAFFGAVFMIYLYLKKRKDNTEIQEIEFPEESNWKIMKELLTIALPIIIGAMVMPVMNMIDLALVLRRLMEIGYTSEQANAMYAQLTGMAATLINLPQVVTSAIAISLVPVISSAYAVKDYTKLQNNTKLAMRVSTIIGLPSAVGLFVLSKPIIAMLFPNESPRVGYILAVMAVGVLFLSLIQSFVSVLQGVGKAHIPVINLFIGAFIKFVLTYVLTGIASLNVLGAAISTVCAYFVAMVLDYIAVRKIVDLRIDIRQMIFAPILSSALMGLSAFTLYNIFYIVTARNSISVLLSIFISGVIYAILLFKLKVISKEDIINLPKGRKIVSKLEKLRLV